MGCGASVGSAYDDDRVKVALYGDGCHNVFGMTLDDSLLLLALIRQGRSEFKAGDVFPAQEFIDCRVDEGDLFSCIFPYASFRSSKYDGSDNKDRRIEYLAQARLCAAMCIVHPAQFKYKRDRITYLSILSEARKSSGLKLTLGEMCRMVAYMPVGMLVGAMDILWDASYSSAAMSSEALAVQLCAFLTLIPEETWESRAREKQKEFEANISMPFHYGKDLEESAEAALKGICEDLVEARVSRFLDDQWGRAHGMEWRVHSDSPTEYIYVCGHKVGVAYVNSAQVDVVLSYRWNPIDQDSRYGTVCLRALTHGQKGNVWIDWIAHLNVREDLNKVLNHMGELYAERPVVHMDVGDSPDVFTRGWTLQEQAVFGVSAEWLCTDTRLKVTSLLLCLPNSVPYRQLSLPTPYLFLDTEGLPSDVELPYPWNKYKTPSQVVVSPDSPERDAVDVYLTMLARKSPTERRARMLKSFTSRKLTNPDDDSQAAYGALASSLGVGIDEIARRAYVVNKCAPLCLSPGGRNPSGLFKDGWFEHLKSMKPEPIILKHGRVPFHRSYTDALHDTLYEVARQALTCQHPVGISLAATVEFTKTASIFICVGISNSKWACNGGFIHDPHTKLSVLCNDAAVAALRSCTGARSL
mmetsp:Transcript_43581/g.105777  ORF Transcript_43581/g.105777 Transcript_43581/m.105777 type:complete len:640 (+) Transcript_43581:294-2213(+)